MPQINTDQWTTRRLLAWMTEHFEEQQIHAPRLISEMLLTHVFGGQRIDLYANVDRIATDTERETLRSFVQRTLKHEPVQYIIGKAMFFGMEFEVNASTLIPRSCTEVIVEQALHICSTKNRSSEEKPIRIADIGTGSGCIAITIAANFPACLIIATDISSDAIELAQKNAKIHGVEDRISFVQGACTEPLASLEPMDIICSNPPYIPDCEMETLEPNVVNWEPKIALSGGSDGLKVVRPLIESAPKYLVSDGVLLMEIATRTRDHALQLAQTSSALKDAIILRDKDGDDRFLRAIKI